MAVNNSTDRVVAGVASYLGNPPNFSNLLGDVYERLIDAEEHYSNVASLYQASPLVKRERLTLTPGKLEYELPPDAGGIRLIRTTPDDEGRSAEIDVVDIQDLSLRPGLNGAGWLSTLTGGDFAVPRACSRVVTEGGPRLVMGATPTAQVECQMYYEPAPAGGEINPEAPPQFLQNFHGLLKIEIAHRMLPLLEWPEPKYSRFEKSLMLRLQEMKALFERYLAQADSEQGGFVPGWGDGRQRYGWG